MRQPQDVLLVVIVVIVAYIQILVVHFVIGRACVNDIITGMDILPLLYVPIAVLHSLDGFATQITIYRYVLLVNFALVDIPLQPTAVLEPIVTKLECQHL